MLCHQGIIIAKECEYHVMSPRPWEHDRPTKGSPESCRPGGVRIITKTCTSIKPSQKFRNRAKQIRLNLGAAQTSFRMIPCLPLMTSRHFRKKKKTNKTQLYLSFALLYMTVILRPIIVIYENFSLLLKHVWDSEIRRLLMWVMTAMPDIYPPTPVPLPLALLWVSEILPGTGFANNMGKSSSLLIGWHHTQKSERERTRESERDWLPFHTGHWTWRES